MSNNFYGYETSRLKAISRLFPGFRFSKAIIYLLHLIALLVLPGKTSANGSDTLRLHRARQISRLHKEGKYEKVLLVLQKVERDNKKIKARSHERPVTYKDNVLYYHYKLSSLLATGKIKNTDELYRLFNRLRLLDKEELYHEQHYRAIKAQLSNAVDAALAKENMELVRKYSMAFARWGDTTDLYCQAPWIPKDEAIRSFLKSFNYTEIDRYALSAPSQKSIEAQARVLTQQYPYDFQRVRAIYTWIVHNISYDYTYSNYHYLETFDSRKGVCNGFSELFYEMCRYANVEVYKVIGKANNGLGIGGHAWNMVTLGGERFIIESTWASCVKAFAEDYFYPDPKTFTTHTAEEIIR